MVYKFGGTSVGSPDRIREAAALVEAGRLGTEGGRPVVVVSAMAGTTSALARLADLPDGPERSAALEAVERRHREAGLELGAVGIDEVLSALARAVERPGGGDDRRDAIVAAGEDLSSRLMVAALAARGLDACIVDAREIIRTDARFGRAVPDDEATVALTPRRLGPLLDRGVIPVLQGFIGADATGNTTTLGRGGSDFTAAIVGAALRAELVTIWTDVDGIFSADPALVPTARVLPELGYEEAVELAWFGARVVHPAAAKHAAARQVALRIRNTFHPEAAGTLIRPDRRETPGVAALAHRGGSVLVRVRSRPLFMAHGFLARVFGILSRHRIAVDLVATSHTSTAFTLEGTGELGAARGELDEVAEVEVTEGLATLSAVGRGLLSAPGVTAELFRILGESPVHLISQASDTSLSFLVDEVEADTLVRRLHRGLLEDRDTMATAARTDPHPAEGGER
jgi:aspartate kinase